MFEIYGRNNCVWCDRAKELLEERGFTYEFSNIETNLDDRKEFFNLFPTKKTVPQIVRHTAFDQIVIGGFDDLVQYLKNVS